MAQASASADGLNICEIVILLIVKISFFGGCQFYNDEVAVLIPGHRQKDATFVFSMNSAATVVL
jgi:hypothetical protein